MGTLAEKKKQLYDLLYEWFACETCADCFHMDTYKDGDNRHPCNRCEGYNLYKPCNELKEDLKDKVNEIIKVIKEEIRD